jgi:GH24 family phage-related lysozyme (muramidase)
MTEETMNALVGQLIEEEGAMACMYLDTRSVITCGVGHALFSLDAALKLPWKRKDGYSSCAGEDACATNATEAEIRDEWDSMRTAKAKMLPLYYSGRSKLCLDEADVRALLVADIRGVCAVLEGTVAGFDTFPEAAQRALVDMAFNLGVSGLEHKFPHLMRDVRARDWAGCAAQCDREGISDARNQATVALFRAAERGMGVGAVA